LWTSRRERRRSSIFSRTSGKLLLPYPPWTT
jgi:hypothetical protein